MKKILATILISIGVLLYLLQPVAYAGTEVIVDVIGDPSDPGCYVLYPELHDPNLVPPTPQVVETGTEAFRDAVSQALGMADLARMYGCESAHIKIDPLQKPDFKF